MIEQTQNSMKKNQSNGKNDDYKTQPVTTQHYDLAPNLLVSDMRQYSIK